MQRGLNAGFDSAKANAPNRVLRLPAVLERTGYSRSRLYARISDGLFPRPVSLGPRVAAWPEHAVDAVIAAQIRAVTDAELVQLVADIHQGRPTFGLGAGAGALVGGTPGSPAA